jgi:hypothetical protein
MEGLRKPPLNVILLHREHVLKKGDDYNGSWRKNRPDKNNIALLNYRVWALYNVAAS